MRKNKKVDKIQRDPSSNNYVLNGIELILNNKDAKIEISFSANKDISIALENCDVEEAIMFLLGVVKELYEDSDKNFIFNKAVLEFFRNFGKEMVEESKELVEEGEEVNE